jgi:hypothetical protein
MHWRNSRNRFTNPWRIQNPAPGHTPRFDVNDPESGSSGGDLLALSRACGQRPIRDGRWEGRDFASNLLGELTRLLPVEHRMLLENDASQLGAEFQMENSASIMCLVFLLCIHLRSLSFCLRDWREE